MLNCTRSLCREVPRLWDIGVSEWGLVFSVICPQFLVFTDKLANILMLNVFGENIV